jgi:uncharacterized protein
LAPRQKRNFGGRANRVSGLHTPCFYFSRNLAVLPAYGSFTGLHPVKANLNDRIYLVGPGEVVEVPRRVPRRR